jgi:hypothetical protein
MQLPQIDVTLTQHDSCDGLWGQLAHPRVSLAIGVVHTQGPLLKLAAGIARANKEKLAMSPYGDTGI